MWDRSQPDTMVISPVAAERIAPLYEQFAHVAVVDVNGTPAAFDGSVPSLIDLIRREVARTLYHLLRSEEANIQVMSEEEFVAFCERVMSEGK